MSLHINIIDVKILDLLQENGQITTKKIAETINLSATAVFERIKKLEKNGFIKKYVALLNEHKLGLKQVIFINLTLKEHTRSYLEKFVNEVKEFPEVLECYRVSGNFDFLIKVLVEDIHSYETFILTKLSLLSNLGNVQSHVALSEAKKTTKVKLNSIL
jgi:DNA-binding Lrp family transcriptional regulator